MLKRRFFWLVIWGIAFAYIEASVVVYLRKIYYPAGFSFPVVLIEPDIAAVELVREKEKDGYCRLCHEHSGIVNEVKLLSGY